MWIGLFNKDMVSCSEWSGSGLPTCDNLLYWSDGTPAVRLSSWNFVEADSGQPCLVNKLNKDLEFNDIFCSNGRAFLCQFDCANIYTGENLDYVY